MLASDDAPRPPPPLLRGREIGALALSIGLVPLNSTMLAVALPSIASEIGVDAAGLTQWLVAGYLLVAIALQSPAGKLSDVLGHARAIALGQAIFTVGSIVGVLAYSVPALVGARALMAAGGAVLVPSALATLRVRLPPARRPRAFGMFSAVMSLSAAIGPLVGGELASRFGWRALFFVNAPPLVIAALLGWGAPRLAASGKTLRTTDWVIDPTLLRHRVLAAAVSIIGLQNMAMYAFVFSLPLVLSRSFGTESKDAGRTLIAMTIAMVASSFASGRLVERIGPRRTAQIGAAAAVIGMLACAMLPLGAPTDLVPPLLLLGAGMGLTTPPAQGSGLDAVTADKSGTAAGLTSTARYLGGVIGVALVSGLLGSGETIARYRIAAWIFAVVLAISFVLALALPRRAAGLPDPKRRS